MNNEHRIPDASTWLAQHRHGELAVQLDEAVSAVVAACLALDKPGQVALVIKIAPSNDMAIISGEVNSRPPKPAPAAAHYYATPDGGLHTSDPYREPLPFPAHDLTEPKAD